MTTNNQKEWQPNPKQEKTGEKFFFIQRRSFLLLTVNAVKLIQYAFLIPAWKGENEGISQNSGGIGLQPDHSYAPSTYSINNYILSQ